MKLLIIKKEAHSLKDTFIAYIGKYGFEKGILNEILNNVFDALLYVQNELKIDLGIREESEKE